MLINPCSFLPLNEEKRLISPFTQPDTDTAAISKAIAKSLASNLPEKLAALLKPLLLCQYPNIKSIENIDVRNIDLITDKIKPIEKYFEKYLDQSVKEYSKQFQNNIETILSANFIELIKEILIDEEKKFSELDLSGKGEEAQ